MNLILFIDFPEASKKRRVNHIMTENYTKVLNKKFNEIDSSIKKIITEVLNYKDKYIKWPTKTVLLWPDSVRIRYHKYPDEIKIKLRQRGIKVDSRSNGPAFTSYLYAGGIRPLRAGGRHEWSIHHIYNGKFPFTESEKTLHAVKSGNHFTQSANLVAIHPIADALAEEYFYFSWVLRKEAFKRFEYDPDLIFCDQVDTYGFMVKK